MKLLFDLLPVILFFVAYKLGQSSPDTAAQWATTWLGALSGEGEIARDQAPILLATTVAIVASLAQVAWQLARRGRVDPVLWLSVGVIVLFGGATIWLNDETFIKWKPTILYWLFAAILLAGRLVWNRNLLRALLGTQLAIDGPVWDRLMWAWVAFFVVIGAINLTVAYRFPTDVWVNFKLFGLLGLTLAFALGIGLWLARHMKEAPNA